MRNNNNICRTYLRTPQKRKTMSEFFTLSELTHSDTATERGIDNTPPSEAMANLQTLAERLLDPVRKLWGKPLGVTSGYRCPELNRAVGGAATSQHLKGEAADISAGSPTSNRRLFDRIVAAVADGILSFDQLIDEHNYRWLHLSYRASGNRNQILHL